MKTTPPTPKKILLTADTVGGVWTYALELARALAPHGVEVALATMGAPLSREQRREAKQLSNTEVYEGSFRLEWMENPWDDVVKAGAWLLELERRVQPDIVHLNSYTHGVLPFRAPKIVVAHSCVLSWWKAVKGEEAPLEWNHYRDAIRKGLAAANLVIAPTRAMLAEVEHYYGVKGGKVIFNGRDPAMFLPGKKQEFIFAAGRLWDEAKNISLLNVIAPDLPWTIYVAGDDKHPNGKEALHRNVCLLGKLPTDLLAKWLGKASIYALPARYEPFGLSVLEAALAGCALVLGDIPSLRQLWNGVANFVSPNDPNELKCTLDKLIRNPVRRKEFAAFAQCRAIQLASHRMAAEYMAAYSGLLAGRRQNKPEEGVCVS